MIVIADRMRAMSANWGSGLTTHSVATERTVMLVTMRRSDFRAAFWSASTPRKGAVRAMMKADAAVICDQAKVPLWGMTAVVKYTAKTKVECSVGMGDAAQS